MAMDGGQLRDQFLRAADAWLCDDYVLDTRYLALKSQDAWRIVEAALILWPVAHKEGVDFSVLTPNVAAGRKQISQISKSRCLDAITSVVAGRMEVDIGSISLGDEEAIDWYSEVPDNASWSRAMQLRVSTKNPQAPTHPRLVAQIDDDLRIAATPFDGLDDLTAQLGFRGDMSGSTAPRIEIAISPPVDFLANSCTLSSDIFVATLLAHPRFELNRIDFAIRTAPGEVASTRRQVAKHIDWGEPKDGLRTGTLTSELPNCDSVLAMLSVAGHTVRRQWTQDPQKAPNPRYVSLQHFDPELRMLRRHLFEVHESRKFEHAVATLMYLLGFSIGLPAETDSPDILGTLQNGESIVVECTLRIPDFAAKAGRLVERRASLSKALTEANLPSAVVAILVCRLSIREISATAKDVGNHDIVLLTHEDLESALMRIRFIQDPIALLREARGVPSPSGIGD